MSSPLGGGDTPRRVSEESPPTSPLSRPSRGREEERCDDGWRFPPLAYMREEEQCSGG
jgi:hypothetical protein